MDSTKYQLRNDLWTLIYDDPYSLHFESNMSVFINHKSINPKLIDPWNRVFHFRDMHLNQNKRNHQIYQYSFSYMNKKVECMLVDDLN